MLEKIFSIAPYHLYLAKGGKIKQPGRFADSKMFFSGIVKPVLPTPAIGIFSLLACCAL